MIRPKMKKSITLTKNKLSEILKAAGEVYELDGLMKVSKDILNNNAAFNKILEKLTTKDVEISSTVNVFGSEDLRNDIKDLDVSQLRAVLLKNNLDPARRVREWKNKENLIDYIVETVQAKKNKGEIFY